jgi:hypothetical protein
MRRVILLPTTLAFKMPLPQAICANRPCKPAHLRRSQMRSAKRRIGARTVVCRKCGDTRATQAHHRRARSSRAHSMGLAQAAGAAHPRVIAPGRCRGRPLCEQRDARSNAASSATPGVVPAPCSPAVDHRATPHHVAIASMRERLTRATTVHLPRWLAHGTARAHPWLGRTSP